MSMAVAAEIKVSLKDIRPTQMEVGLAHVDYSRVKIEKIAKNSNLLDAAASRVLPGWIGPDGKIFITDGHHWASGAQRVARLHPEIADQIQLTIDIEADFKGKSWDEFYRALHQAGKGYFVPEVRSKYLGKGDKKVAQMYQKFLPKDLSGLQNNAGRSLFGMALEEIGIDPNFDLVDYIEFYLNEDFRPEIEKKLGIQVSSLSTPESITPELIRKVQNEMVSQPKMVNFLLNNTRPGVDPSLARANLLKAINKYRTDVLHLEALAHATPSLSARECAVRFQAP